MTEKLIKDLIENLLVLGVSLAVFLYYVLVGTVYSSFELAMS